MPCMCWFTPSEESRKLIKSSCEVIVNEIKRLEKEGDHIGISIRETKELLDHLYTGKCSEKEKHHV